MDEKIRLLDRLHRINRETPDQLYQLRKWSNRAVHAEAGVLDEETQKALAGCALEVVCDLLETAFRYKYVGDAVPAYMSILQTRSRLWNFFPSSRTTSEIRARKI